MSDSDSKIAQYHLHRAHPEKLQFEIYSLREYRNKNVIEASRPHSHSYYQIIWFFEAGGTHTIDFKSYEIQDHTLMFVTKDQIHFFDDTLKIDGWLIHFNESFFTPTDVDIFLKYNIFNSLQNPCYSIDQDTVGIAKSYISLIQSELRERHRFGYEDVVRFLLKSFLINLERIQQKNPKENTYYELQFFKFKALVETHYKESLSIQEYSALLHISSKTLTTITKSIAHKSPSQLIAERIILEAKRLLKFTTLQISEIAFQLGFEDASYFVKYFKRYIGSSPRDYRASIL